MSDSDHHHARRPPGRTTSLLPTSGGPRGARVLAPTQRGSAHHAALAATSALDEPALRSIKNCCRVVHDIALMAPSHTVYEYHEDYLLQLAADVHTLGQWVQSSLRAFRTARRATSASPAPAPVPATPPTPTPAPMPAPPHVLQLPAYPTPSPGPEEPSSLPAATVVTPRPHVLRSTPKLRDRPTPRTPRPTDAHPSITLRYIGTLREHKRPHPRYIIDVLKCIEGISLAAVSYTRDHQVVLYPKAPCTVQDLIRKRGALHNLLDTIFGPAGKALPACDDGSAWTRVVVHRAPLPYYKPRAAPSFPLPISYRLGDLADDLCASNNVDRNSVHDVRPLCPLDKRDTLFFSSEKDSPQHCSLMLCLSDAAAASRLLKHGAIIQNAHCRVTPYRARQPLRCNPTPPGS